MPISRTAAGIRIALRVTPKARREGIGGVVENAEGARALKVSVTAAPEGGKANDAVIRLLAKSWKLPKSSIALVSGAASRNKTVEIAGDPVALEALLREKIAASG